MPKTQWDIVVFLLQITILVVKNSFKHTQQSDMFEYTHIHIYIYMCVYVCVCMYVCIYLSIYLCIYVSMYLCMYTVRPTTAESSLEFQSAPVTIGATVAMKFPLHKGHGFDLISAPFLR